VFSLKPPLSRRSFLSLTGVAIGSSILPACSKNTNLQSELSSPSPLFYKPETTGNLWDTWMYYHEGIFYLYYNPSPRGPKGLTNTWSGVALAISSDGIHWQEYGEVIEKPPEVVFTGAGAVWPAGDRFIMNFSEWRGPIGEDSGRQTIFFAESRDLIHWQPLGSEYEFRQDERWYEPNGRWDNIWSIPRPEGGYYGYWAAAPKNKQVGIGFGESDDGISWRALPPALIEGTVPSDKAVVQGTEVSGAYYRQGKYYVLLRPSTNLDIVTMVSDSAGGPFQPAPQNHRLMTDTTSYFLRFLDVGDDVLVNHHSWEVPLGGRLEIDPERVYLAPLKRAQWDDKGTLRLMWWEQNNLAKGKSLPISPIKSIPGSLPLLDSLFDPQETLILEGMMSLPDSKDKAPTGLYIQGTGKKGTGFLVYQNGRVEYGDMSSDGSAFEKIGHADRGLQFEEKAHFRLILKGSLTEFYLNDYLMQCYSTSEPGTGRIGFIGSESDFDELKAWYCA